LARLDDGGDAPVAHDDVALDDAVLEDHATAADGEVRFRG
jgi:hypothetical protein